MHRKMAFILRLTLIVFIRKGKSNIEKRKIPIPIPSGGMEIDEFEFYNNKSNL